MEHLSDFETALWGLSVLLQAALLALVAARKAYRHYPFFTAYVLFVIVQNVSFFVTYRFWGYRTLTAYRVYWVTQALVLCARALGVLEMCRIALARFQGIWRLARFVFVISAITVCVSAFLAGDHGWRIVVTTAEIGCNLAIGAIVVALFLFARHYSVVIQQTIRLIAVGFFLYSCFLVLSDAIFQKLLYPYTTLWNVLSMGAFISSLLIWMWAFRAAAPVPVKKQSLLSRDVYRELAPEINARLRLLNDQLTQLWRMERP